MLVAKRDPPFHVDAHDDAPAYYGARPDVKAPRIVRFVTAIQMIGSLLAVPIGIASAYSFYRANFSPETTCQNLRSGIVAMLDKSVDTATRRILVRRDVEAFEKTCGTVDPEATAAFKTLLATDKVPAPVTAAADPGIRKPPREVAPREPVHKVEPHQQSNARQAPSNPVPEIETARRDPAVSDAQWLDAVRAALVTHKPQDQLTDSAKPKPTPPSAAIAPSNTPDAAPAVVNRAPLDAPPAVPTLPPPISVAPPPQRADANHPVPPGSIPDAPSSPNTELANVDEHHRSRIGKWIAEIPLLGSIVENGRQ
jgi:hypothetical protein